MLLKLFVIKGLLVLERLFDRLDRLRLDRRAFRLAELENSIRITSHGHEHVIRLLFCDCSVELWYVGAYLQIRYVISLKYVFVLFCEPLFTVLNLRLVDPHQLHAHWAGFVYYFTRELLHNCIVLCARIPRTFFSIARAAHYHLAHFL